MPEAKEGDHVMRTSEVKAAAVNQWKGILREAGIDLSCLSGKHAPCPRCGGKDRFRFDDKEGRGTYYCNQCGPGDGFDLLKFKLNSSFPEAKEFVEKHLRLNGYAHHEQTRKPVGTPGKVIKAILKDCKEKHPLVERYLRYRGLHCIPRNLLYHGALRYYDENNNIVGEYPGMVAKIQDNQNKVQALHRTFFSKSVENRKKVTPPVDTVNGCAVRVFDLDGSSVLGVAEGIETAIAAHELAREPIPVWACLSANVMREFEPPEGVKLVRIFGDNDEGYDGQAAAYALAKRLAHKGINAEVYIPKRPGDWLDVLNRRTGRSHERDF